MNPYVSKCDNDNHYFNLDDNEDYFCQCGKQDRREIKTNHEDSINCWCEPELSYRDENGSEVWVHREIQ